MGYKKQIDEHIKIIDEQYRIVNGLISEINKKDKHYFEIKQQLDYYKNYKKFMYGYEPTKNEVICLNRGLKETKAEAMALRKQLDEQQSEARIVKRKHEKIIDEIKEREIAKIKNDQ